VRRLLAHLIELLLFTMTFCCPGCQQSGSDKELGTVVTDLSQVPGTDTPYQLPDLAGQESKKADDQSTQPVGKPPAPDKTPAEHSESPSGTPRD